MARIIAYQSTTPATDDLLLGTQKTTSGTNKTNPTKNFTVDSVVQAGLGYTVYTAVISQTGTSAPTVNKELKNNTGATFTWLRISAGVYRIQSSTPIFDQANIKTIVFLNAGSSIPLITGERTSDTILTIKTFVSSSGAAVDASITNGSFEVRIYS